MLALGGCVADPPPLMGAAQAGDQQATVSWSAPLAAPFPVAAYEVTAWAGQVAQRRVRFNSTATTETVTGLTNRTTYTFTVVAINALGNESAGSDQSNPVTPGPAAHAIAAGSSHTCAIVTGGAVQCWGLNSVGELGNGTVSSAIWTPVPVTGLTGATAIAAGGDRTCAIVAGGAVDCWGLNGYGELGNGTTTSSSSPVAVTGITGAIAIAAGSEHTCAIVAGGTVDCWGFNFEGQLGIGTNSDSSLHTHVPGVTGATAIAAGAIHTCAIVTGGAVDCWGDNSYGQLGKGFITNDPTIDWTPQPVSGVTGASSIAAGDFHTCVIVAGGTVDCWGYEGAGQLGNGVIDDASMPTPVPVMGLTSVTAISAGGYHTAALLPGGLIDGWGADDNGQLGNGDDIASATPVAVSWA